MERPDPWTVAAVSVIQPDDARIPRWLQEGMPPVPSGVSLGEWTGAFTKLYDRYYRWRIEHLSRCIHSKTTPISGGIQCDACGEVKAYRQSPDLAPPSFKWTLMPWDAVGVVAKAIAFGAAKYKPDGWKTIPNARAHNFNSLMNHLTNWSEGRKTDEESGLPALAHAGARLLFLIWFEMNPTKEIDK